MKPTDIFPKSFDECFKMLITSNGRFFREAAYLSAENREIRDEIRSLEYDFLELKQKNKDLNFDLKALLSENRKLKKELKQSRKKHE